MGRVDLKERLNYSYLLPSLIAIGLMGLVLFPLLLSGYISDDAINSYTPGFLIENHQSVGQYTYNFISNWIHGGRFFPLAFYEYTLFTLVHSLVIYKGILFFLTIVDSMLFVYLIFILTSNRLLSILSFLTLPMFLVFRAGHDPILSFCGMLQIVFCYTLISLILLKYFLNTKRTTYFVLSIITYCLSMMTYEITYPFFLLHATIIWFDYKQNQGKKTLKRSLLTLFPYFISSLFFVMLSLLLRHIYDAQVIGKTSPYTINIAIVPIFMTYLRQIVSTLPLSYIAFDPDGYFFRPRDFLALRTFLLLVPSLLLFMVGFWNGKDEEKTRIQYKLSMVLGALIWLLPGIMISLSNKYQEYIVWGRPYLPIFIQNFGLDLILISGGMYFKSKMAKGNIDAKERHFAATHYILLITLFILTSVAGYSNYMVVEKENVFWRYPREMIEKAIDKNFFNDIPSNSSILVDDRYPWDKSAFYTMKTGVHFQNVAAQGHYLDDLKGEQFKGLVNSNNDYVLKPEQNVYYLRYGSDGLGRGYVLLASLNKLKVNNDRIVTALGNDAKVFLLSPEVAQKVPQVSGLVADITQEGRSKWFVERGTELRTVSSGKDWAIYQVDNLGGLIDLKSVGANYLDKTAGLSAYWNLANKDQLILRNDKTAPLHIGFVNGLIMNGAELQPVKLENSFSVQVVAKPFTTQKQYAAIIGNHPGDKNYSGFIIQQDGLSTNNYYFTFGNGKGWIGNINFVLVSDQWNYVTVTVNAIKHEVLLYVNGKLVIRHNVDELFCNSNQPVYVGNWIGGDRQFNGLISEVEISNRVLTAEEISENNDLLTKETFNVR